MKRCGRDADAECAAGTWRGARRSQGPLLSICVHGAARTGRGVQRALDVASSEVLRARQARGAVEL